ncbi:MAG TPA: XrtA/PEP-CTERM system histidine kinase PrsK, partial [Rhodocyclaceae bacterium]|nr:XrtA/PEP-CTERM system histidine kinase PrsK [Rhodocyclaceae bacterium]
MDVATATLSTWSYGLAAFGYLTLLVYLTKQPFGRQPGQAGRALLYALGASGAWATIGAVYALTGAGVVFRLYLFADVLRYAAWYLCLILMLVPNGVQLQLRALCAKRLIQVGFCIIVFCLAVQAWLTLQTGEATLLAQMAQLSALAMVVFALVLLEQLLRNATADSHWNFKPLWLGLAGTFVFDLHLYSDILLFHRMDADVFAIRGFVVALILPLIALSIVRNKNREIRLALSQTAVFHSTTLVLVGAYLLFVSAAGYYVRYFGGEWGRALQLIVFFVAALILALVAFSGSMRAKIRVWISKHFFRYRYDYRQEWLKFTNALSAEGQAQEVGQRVIRGLADMVESPAGALWLRDAGGQRYMQAARWNTPEVAEPTSVGVPLIHFLSESGWVLNMEEYRHMPGRYAGLEFPEWLKRLNNVWLIVPLSTGKELVGFVLLTTARTDLDVDWEVNDLLKTAGRQAASYIAQMQATEALLEARKFDSFNRMSAFVVHDLKNI